MDDSSKIARGLLSVVATPIGNLGDISIRAIETLQGADFIYCEDSRNFSKLAKRFEIKAKLVSYHDHNERGRIAQAKLQLEDSKHIALVSDAGTPLVSDPGYHLVNLAHSLGTKVQSIPGACAAIAALSISGFEPHRFIFEGFLPVKKLKKRKAIQEAISSNATVIFYESPHRILNTVEIISEESPKIEICIARELTKLHEEVIRASASEVFESLRSRSSIKGEIVLLIRGYK